MNNVPTAEELLPYGINPDIFLSLNFVVVDFETTNIAFGDSRVETNDVVCASWLVCKPGKEPVMKSFYGGAYQQTELADDIEAADFFIAHNAKFEYGWLKRIGVQIDQKLAFCTMIAKYVIQGNERVNGSLKLDTMGREYLGEHKISWVSKMITGGVCPSLIPAGPLVDYCEQDVWLTYKLSGILLMELIELNLLPVMFTRSIVTPVLVEIEANGMHLDADKVLEENIKYERELSDISKQISEFTGGINLNSPKQVAELLYEGLGFSELKDRRGNAIRTASDGRSTSAATIAKLKTRNRRQREFVKLYEERARLNSALTKNLRYFRGICEQYEGTFYANYNQTVTKTHRLSSSGVKVPLDVFDGKEKGIQLQNSPRIFKPLYTARNEGWSIGEIDGAQLEFRVAAFLGRDPVATRDIVEGVDVHQYTADKLTAAGEDTSRQDAKSRTFKPLYGGESGTDAEREYFAAFKEKYKGVADAQNTWIDTVERSGKLVTETGLIFYWPDTHVTRSGYVTNTTSICNFPVQSFATADIIPIALTLNYFFMKRELLETFVVNTIHDSVISEVAPGEEEQYHEIGHWSFTDGVLEYLDKVYDIQFDVPLGTETKVGSHWGVADKVWEN